MRERALWPGVIWCRNSGGNGWSFPPAIATLLQELTKGRTVLHLFGGLARWGTRLDIDSTVNPHVRGDAWLAPFRRDSFDVVILDPPYSGINQQLKQYVLRSATFVAREHIYWFHTMWITGGAGLRRERSWLVRVGDACACRCLIEWRVVATEKAVPTLGRITRGPALKYHRWLGGSAGGLPFGDR